MLFSTVNDHVLPRGFARGVSAFAARQAAIREGLAVSFYKLWLPIVTSHSLSVSWPSELESISSQSISTVDSTAIANLLVELGDGITDLGFSSELMDEELGAFELMLDLDSP